MTFIFSDQDASGGQSLNVNLNVYVFNIQVNWTFLFSCIGVLYTHILQIDNKIIYLMHLTF
jgi:hypothetical protein